jgi:MoaA/NifB/PqqE/SkfB family radical SAM enzyme
MMGGEPLLRKDWPSIGERVREVGMDLSIITNGYKITESKFQRILDVNPELVTVSIDGGHAAVHDRIRGVPGSFKQVVATLRRFVESGLPTGVITTVHKMNLSELPTIRKFLLGTGVAWQIQGRVLFAGSLHCCHPEKILQEGAYDCRCTRHGLLLTRFATIASVSLARMSSWHLNTWD